MDSSEDIAIDEMVFSRFLFSFLLLAGCFSRSHSRIGIDARRRSGDACGSRNRFSFLNYFRRGAGAPGSFGSFGSGADTRDEAAASSIKRNYCSAFRIHERKTHRRWRKKRITYNGGQKGETRKYLCVAQSACLSVSLRTHRLTERSGPDLCN